MPLIKSKSKKAMSENIESEMEHGKPQKQAIAIAYSIKRRADKKEKKMNEGGDVKRPSPTPLMSDEKRKKSLGEKINYPKGASLNEGGEVSTHLDEDMAEHDHMRDEEKMGGQFAFGGDIDEHMAEEDHKIDEEIMSGHHISGMKPKMSRSPINLDESLAEEDHEMNEEKMGGQFSHGGSIADKIMRKKHYSDGGRIDLSQNADESPNMEDRYSFDALRKENYSESDAIDHMEQPMDSNEHGMEMDNDDLGDMVSMIRKRMRERRGY